ncbi:hypothetical protein Lal_00018625 [Lupinus albus]|nr:hypothetical protein Lal_00018625 [Lupinus albus]
MKAKSDREGDLTPYQYTYSNIKQAVNGHTKTENHTRRAVHKRQPHAQDLLIPSINDKDQTGKPRSKVTIRVDSDFFENGKKVTVRVDSDFSENGKKVTVRVDSDFSENGKKVNDQYRL